MKGGAYGAVRFRKSLAYFLPGRALQGAASLLVLLVLVRLLPLDDYGAYMVVLGLMEIVASSSSFGLSHTVQYFVPQVAEREPGLLHRVIALLAIARLLILGVFVAAIALAWEHLATIFSFSPMQIEATRWIFLLILFTQSTRLLVDALDALLHQKAAQAVMLLVPLGKLAGFAIVYEYVGHLGLEHVLLVECAVMFLCVALATSILNILLRPFPTTGNPIDVAPMFAFAWKMAGSDWLNTATSQGAVRAVVAWVLGLGEAGLLGFIQKLADMLQRYSPAVFFQSLVRPVLTAKVQVDGDTEILTNGCSLLLKANLIAYGGFLVSLAVYGDEMIALVSGGRFEGVGFVFGLVVLWLIVESQRHVLTLGMQVSGHADYIRWLAFLSPIILVGVAVASPAGLNTVVGVLCGGTAIWNVFALHLLSHKGVEYITTDKRGLAGILAATVLAVATGRVASLGLPPVAAAGLACIAYVFCLTKLSPLRKEEIAIVAKAAGARSAKALAAFARGGGAGG